MEVELNFKIDEEKNLVLTEEQAKELYVKLKDLYEEKEAKPLRVRYPYISYNYGPNRLLPKYRLIWNT
jgi:hypothetical protein